MSAPARRPYVQPARVLWRGGAERGVTTLVSAETHAAFEKLAIAHGLSKAALNKKLIEAVVERPELLVDILESEP